MIRTGNISVIQERQKSFDGDVLYDVKVMIVWGGLVDGRSCGCRV